LEDESRQIGAVWIPLPMFRQMQEAPRVILEVPFAERVEQILGDYVCEDLAAHCALDPEHGFDHFAGSLLNSLDRIRKRLGELRWREARALLEAALAQHRAHDDPALHREWIALLLNAYYDPMYEYQMEKSAARVLFRGEREAVRAWCLNRAARDPG
jgi:tRNA 2-selenouridine synthase